MQVGGRVSLGESVRDVAILTSSGAVERPSVLHCARMIYYQLVFNVSVLRSLKMSLEADNASPFIL